MIMLRDMLVFGTCVIVGSLCGYLDLDQWMPKESRNQFMHYVHPVHNHSVLV